MTQIELGKLNNEKQIKKQLETAPPIKDSKIAEYLKRLKDFHQKRTNDDDNNNNDDGFRRSTTSAIASTIWFTSA